MTSQQLTHRLNEAIAHHNGGRVDRAEAIFQQVAKAAPRAAVVFDLWGQTAEQQGRPEDAVRHYAQACKLEERFVPVAIRLAFALIAVGRPTEAEKAMRSTVQRNPRSAEGWNALGFTLKVQGKIGEALACQERAVTLDPKFAEGWMHYGFTLGLVGRNFEALPMYDRALALDPKIANARFGRAQSLDKLYRLEESIAEYDRFLQLQPNHLEARSNRLFALQNSATMSREELYAEHRRYGKIVGEGPAALPGYDFSPDRRLRVAILSPDLRTHSCAYFLEPLIRHLDREQFELYLYHDHFVEDAMSARLRTHAAVWRNFVGQSQTCVERTIRADKPDIIVDLAGHIGVMIRLPILAKRLAPVQITYLGYPDTTGVPAMDFRFTDAIADPVADAERFATEELVRFAPVAWAYQPPIDAPEISAPPSSAGQSITFGCFNSPTKFSDPLLAAWGEILAGVPNSRLVLKGRDFQAGEVRAQMLARLGRYGIAGDRVDLLPRAETTAEHLAHYARIDIALDTFPYNGTTTTCEALWMGRPVVTRCGDRHASRVGASLLSAIGHPEWIAADTAGYVERARALASDSQALADRSRQLRAELRQSVLLDEIGQSRRFAAALRECWRRKTTSAAVPQEETYAGLVAAH